jgi:hypothetical protein
MDGDTAPVFPLVADPDPAGGRPPPTACAYQADAYAYGRAASPPATATPAATTTAAPTCAPSYCTASSRAPSYCAAACAASAPGCCTASAAPAATSARRKSYALAEPGIVFLVEDVKRPQADVGNFLLIESDGRTQ